jgi:hypothetical protein
VRAVAEGDLVALNCLQHGPGDTNQTRCSDALRPPPVGADRLVWCAALFCTYRPTCAEAIGEPGCLLSSSKSRVSSRPNAVVTL